MTTMLEFLTIAAKEVRDQLLQQQLGKKPDGDQERAHKKMKFDRNFSEKEPERRPTIGIEPNSCPAKSNDKGKKAEKSEKKRKRTKDSDFGGNVELSEDVRKKIEEKARLGGEEKLNIVLVIQKVLEKSDVVRQQNRVTIPQAQIQNKFLSQEEEQELDQKIGNHYAYMTVPIIEPSGRVEQVQMRRWNVGKQSISYVLNGDWKHVVEFNQLQEGQTMQLWAFRIQEVLHFAFVLLPVSSALPQTGCLMKRRFDEASTSRAPPLLAEIHVQDGQQDSEQTERPRWRFDLNMEPELE